MNQKQRIFQILKNYSKIKNRHDKYSPYWATAFIILTITGLATTWVELGAFWKGYVLDIAGPAWNYILFRGLYTSKKDNKWYRFFSPERTFIIFLLFCIGVETAQYFGLYNSTFDPWDFVAYISLLFPIFLLDYCQIKMDKK